MKPSDPSDAPLAFRLTADGFGRLPLPKDLARQIPWLKGDEAIDAWLFLLPPGRFRLLNEEEVLADPDLESIRAFIQGDRSEYPSEPSSAQPPDLASLPVRLLKTTLRRHGPSWRIWMPAITEIFAPAYCDRNDFIVSLAPDGYWELWFTEAFRQAALGPLPAAMRNKK